MIRAKFRCNSVTFFGDPENPDISRQYTLAPIYDTSTPENERFTRGHPVRRAEDERRQSGCAAGGRQDVLPRLHRGTCVSWSTVWAAWLAVTAVSFAVLEWVTLRRRETLSENLRRWLGVDPPKPWRRISIVLFTGAVIGFAAWFVPHIVG